MRTIVRIRTGSSEDSGGGVFAGEAIRGWRGWGWV